MVSPLQYEQEQGPETSLLNLTETLSKVLDAGIWLSLRWC